MSDIRPYRPRVDEVSPYSRWWFGASMSVLPAEKGADEVHGSIATVKAGEDQAGHKKRARRHGRKSSFQSEASFIK